MKKTIIRNMDRDIVGRFACTGNTLKKRKVGFLEKAKSAAITLALYSFITVIALGFFYAGGYFNPVTVIRAQEVQIDNLSGKIDDIKDQVVNSIQSCESAGASESAGLITFDPHKTNKSVQIASVGSFQYKASTVQYYYKLLYKETLTTKQAILIALDDDKARQLTHDILFETKNGADNWINCTAKASVKSKLAVINELTK